MKKKISSTRVVLATTTFFRDPNELRFSLACQLVKEAVATGYLIFIVDASPDLKIMQELRKSGATVERQRREGMGASRRQVFALARRLAPEFEVIVWTEAEKVDIVRWLPKIVKPLISGLAGIVIPKRSQQSWRTYPSFQAITEQIANKVYQAVSGLKADPMFGPVAFNSAAAKHLEQFSAEEFGVNDNYIQHYAPLVALSYCFKIVSPVVNFIYPALQKEQEESDAHFKKMFEKRLWQLQQLVADYLILGKRLGLTNFRDS